MGGQAKYISSMVKQQKSVAANVDHGSADVTPPSLGQLVQASRTKKKYTQLQLAEKLIATANKSSQKLIASNGRAIKPDWLWISKLENDGFNRGLPEKIIGVIADALGVKKDELLKAAKRPKPDRPVKVRHRGLNKWPLYQMLSAGIKHTLDNETSQLNWPGLTVKDYLELLEKRTKHSGKAFMASFMTSSPRAPNEPATVQKLASLAAAGLTQAYAIPYRRVASPLKNDYNDYDEELDLFIRENYDRMDRLVKQVAEVKTSGGISSADILLFEPRPPAISDPITLVVRPEVIVETREVLVKFGLRANPLFQDYLLTSVVSLAETAVPAAQNLLSATVAFDGAAAQHPSHSMSALKRTLSQFAELIDVWTKHEGRWPRESFTSARWILRSINGERMEAQNDGIKKTS